MVRRPPLSKAEMQVTRVLWGLGSATVRQVHEAMALERKIDFTTVQTYLSRLETKGYLRSRMRGRSRVFTARARPRQVIGETVDDFLDRLFGGETLPLMRHLIQERGISDAEFAKLHEMLSQWKDEQDESSK